MEIRKHKGYKEFDNNGPKADGKVYICIKYVRPYTEPIYDLLFTHTRDDLGMRIWDFYHNELIDEDQPSYPNSLFYYW